MLQQLSNLFFQRELLDSEGIGIYSTENEEKSMICERWNRTIKTKMWKQFTVQNSTEYISFLPRLVEEYNNTKHRSIGMTPAEASKKKNESSVFLKLYGDLRVKPGLPKYKVGDRVRISKYKRSVFDKGYTPNWTEEIFVVDTVVYTDPITYKLKDLSGEEILGSFYEQELLRSEQSVDGPFRIEKVIRKNPKGKNTKVLVKWSGYPEKFNSWVDAKDLKDLKDLA